MSEQFGPGGIPPFQGNVEAPITDNKQGLWGFVFSIIGLLTCGLLSIVGLVLSILGLKKQPKQLAVAGVVISSVGMVMVLLILPVGMGIAIAVPSFLRAREISRRNACQENQSRIDGAKQQWALESNQDASATPKWSDLVGEASYLSRSPVCPSNGDYTIGAVGEDPSCSLSGQPDFPHLFPAAY